MTAFYSGTQYNFFIHRKSSSFNRKGKHSNTFTMVKGSRKSKGSCTQNKIAVVMKEYYGKGLKSGSGGMAKSASQAKAIAYSEARKKCHSRKK